MGEMIPMPRITDVFADVRGDDRTMRVSLHPRGADRNVVVVSLWLGPLCRGSFRMAPGDLDRLISMLGEMRTSLRAGPVATGPAAPGPTAMGSAAVASSAASPAVGPDPAGSASVDPAVRRVA